MQKRRENDRIPDGLRVLEHEASLSCSCGSFIAAEEAYEDLVVHHWQQLSRCEKDRAEAAYAMLLQHRLSCVNSAASDGSWSRGSGSRASPDVARSESDSIGDPEPATRKRRSRPVKLVDFDPIRVSGGPLSEDIIRDRR